MFVIVQSVSGPAAGKQVHLRAGQSVRFGRTEWADYCFAEDAQMGDIHFTIDCDPRSGCTLTVEGSSVTLVDGEEVTQAALRDGNEITAGATVFRILIEGDPGGPGSAAPPRAETEGNGQPTVTAAELCAPLSLSDAAKTCLQGDPPPAEFFEALLQQKLLRDAALFLARWLPKRSSLWWGAMCLEGGTPPSPKGDSPLALAVRWFHHPTDEQRRAAMDAANRAEMKTPEAWMGAAVFWCEGPLGPPGYETPPAAEHLTAVAVHLALTLKAERGTPAEIAQAYERFLELGQRVQSGEIEVPVPGETTN